MSENVATQLDALRQEAMRCLFAADYTGARTTANACLLLIATIPDGQLAGLSSQTWNRQGIVLFLDQLDKLEASANTSESGGMVLQSYSYSGRRSC